MKKMKFVLFLNILLSFAFAHADDVFMATSEDLHEFDQMLAKDKKTAQPVALPGKQPGPAPPTANGPRDQFMRSKNGVRPPQGPAGNPMNQRPPPASGSPGDSGSLPPPPPNGGAAGPGAGGNPPPPPPPQH